MLLGTTSLWIGYLWAGEIDYAAAMASNDLVDKVNFAGQAKAAYPYSPRFRAAQPLMVYDMARTMPDMVPVAALVLGNASRADPGSVDLLSRWIGALRALHRCEEAAEASKRLARLAPRSEPAQKLAHESCPPK